VDDLPRSLILIAIILLVVLPIHEFAHALSAYLLGDPTAKYRGRLTLNPIAHFDPVGGLFIIFTILIGFGIGWAKPTPVNPANLRGGRKADALVAAAGPLSNLILAVAAAIPLRYLAATGLEVPDLVFETLAFLIFINIALMLFNFLPIPPLDGSHVMFALMDPQTAWRWRATLQQYGIFILLLVIIPLGPGGQSLVRLLISGIGIPIVNLLAGFELFGS
jgi:Zn-dependent protease